MNFSELLNEFFHSINEPIWSYVLVFILAGTGLYFSFGTGFAQFRYIFKGFKPLSQDPMKIGERGITDYQAFSISVSSRVGVGNITGIATAIAIGGPGSVFWMWVFTFFGMIIAFVESTLGQIYKEKDGANFKGGPSYYLEKALNMRWLGVIFAIVLVITYGFIFNMLQANNIATSLTVYNFDPLSVGIIIAVLVALVIFGGTNSIAAVASVIAPGMIIFYVAVTTIVIILNITQIPMVFSEIFSNAFSGAAASGGALGTVVLQGVKRGLFSNEAGMGSTPNASAVAHTRHPVNQGLVQSVSVFLETFVICTATAFIVIISGVYNQGLAGFELAQESMQINLGGFANVFLSIAIFTFAFSTIIGNHFFAESNVKYLTKNSGVIWIFRILVVFLVILGADIDFTLIWTLADFFMAIMAFINLYAIIRLFPKVRLALYDFENQIAEGLIPTFHKNTIDGLESDVWDNLDYHDHTNDAL